MGCAFLLLRETRKTRRLYGEILKELKKPRPLHEADMRRILRRIDDMNTKLSAALAALGTSVSALTVATDAETGKLASIEEQLRNSTGLSESETNDLADQIAGITSSITSSTTKLTDSLSDVHEAAGGSTGGSDQGGLSGVESGGVAGSAGSPTPTDDQPAGDAPQGSGSGDAVQQDPPQG